MGVTTAVLCTGGALATAAVGWSVLWWLEGERCEKPSYTVRTVWKGKPKFSLRDFNVMEVREYEPYVVAQATVTGTMRKSMSGGFMKVARYIFGDNVKKGAEVEEDKESIAMTAPVRVETPENTKISMTSPVQMQAEGTAEEGNGSDGAAYKISFVMPSKYTLETLPVPKDTELELKEVPAHTLAAYTFFGAIPSEKKVSEVAETLKAKLEEEGMKVSGTPLIYQYHPPFAPPFLRRVEVLYAVE